MSGKGAESDLGALADKLGQEGAITAAQAEMIARLADEIGRAGGRRRSSHDVLVRTAVPLTAAERKRLEELIATRFGAGRRVTLEVDPAVLGGVWLRVGDRIIDGSLRGRLQALRQQLA